MSGSNPTFDLFVYGSLRSGHSANDMLRDCKLVGEAVVNGILYDIDDKFTAVILYGDSPVPGELWRCPAQLLKMLDEYEGIVSGLFRRVGTVAHKPDGSGAPCWIYAAGPALSRKLVPENRIDSIRAERRTSGPNHQQET